MIYAALISALVFFGFGAWYDAWTATIAGIVSVSVAVLLRIDENIKPVDNSERIRDIESRIDRLMIKNGLSLDK